MYYRNSHRRCSIKKVVLKNFAKFAGKYLCHRLWHRCFPVNSAKFLRTAFSQNTSGRLLLVLVIILYEKNEIGKILNLNVDSYHVWILLSSWRRTLQLKKFCKGLHSERCLHHPCFVLVSCVDLFLASF